jgi:hypothetical protein
MAATPTSWKREPFEVGIPIPYQAVFSDEQFNQLQMGLIPKVMEDKWYLLRRTLSVLASQLDWATCLPTRFEGSKRRRRSD